jgi:hypothetical protein
MRIAEFALLLVPVALIVAWIFGLRGLSPRGTLAAVALLAVAGIALLCLGEGRSFNGRYVPARFNGEAIIPGHPK